MTTSPLSPERDIFLQALDQPVAERAAFLDQACGNDLLLRRRIESLLRALENAEDFLESPVLGTISAMPRPDAAAGDLIGRYKLLQKLGEGGCGVVYLAEQEEPVRRRVALKVIKLGMDTRDVIARFEAERQALALMDHPNIAKVLDAGATETGRPYFVMELVRGIKITDYCDQNNLPTAERLNLFSQVCHAVQHAHQKGIIHRDIKPSNILVTLHDGVPVPKVIDFGIAKATQGRLTDKTVFTAFEQFIGTPAYMSPEQAEMSGLDIDTRSDIYSLGVLLYELLTGHTPFDAKELAQAGLDEMRRRIREVEPQRPSTRLSTMEGAALTVTANHRQIESGKLLNLIRGDLDWIVMRCLEKDRTRRYETATGLADDIRRHLTHEPVTATPPSTAYLLQKLVHRHRTAFAAAAAIAAALVLGAAIATWQAVRATRAEHRAQAERKLAEQRRTEVETINKLLLSDTLKSADPEFSRGRDITVREVLDNAAARIPKAFADNPQLEAAIRASIGETYLRLSAMEKAEVHLQAALETRRKLLGEEHPDTLAVLRALAAVRVHQLRSVEGEALIRKVIAIQERTLGADHEETLKSLGVLFDLKDMDAQKGRPLPEWKPLVEQLEPLARATYTKASQRFGPEHPIALVHQHNLLSSLTRQLIFSKEKLPEADAVSQQLLATRRRVLEPDHPDTLYSMEERAEVLSKLDRGDEAEKLMREIIAGEERVFGQEHWMTGAAYRRLAISLRFRRGERAEVYKLALRATDILLKGYGHDYPVAYGMLDRLAEWWFEDGLGNEAVNYAQERLPAARRRLPPNSPTLRALLHLRGSGLLQQGRPADAKPVLRECLTLWEATQSEELRRFDVQSMLGAALLAEKKFAEAEPLLLGAYEGMQRGFVPSMNRAQLRFALSRLTALYTQWGKPDKAAEWKTKLDAAPRPTLPPPPQPISDAVLQAKAPVNLAFAIAATGSRAPQVTVEPPQPWRKTGSQPASYVVGVDPAQARGQSASAYIKSVQSPVASYGGLSQGFAAGEHLGRRVRFRAMIKTENVEQGAWLWLGFNRREGGQIAMDNMSDRRIKGTATWTPAAIVMDVPAEAAAIYLGLFLSGTGQMWVNDAQFEVVGADVPVTKAAAKTAATTGK